MNKHSLYWICQLGAWSLYGILEIFLYSTANRLDTSKIIGEIFLVTFYILSTHGLREILLRTRLIQFRWFQILPRLLIIIVLLAVSNYFFLLAVSSFLGSIDASRDYTLLSFTVNVAISIILYFVWSLLYLSFLYVERYNKSLQFQAIAKEIELSNLKSQLNPHFMFNALNSIRALIDENPSKAKHAITQLSNLLRNSLGTDSKKLIPFGEEMATVRDYLELETIRYEERLETSFQIHPTSNRFQIPPLMIQTLVENGIKHGIANLKQGGRITINSGIEEGRLKIEIRNSGQYRNGVRLNLGYGLLNTRKRLNLIYGESADFSIINEDDKTVLTTIAIPEKVSYMKNRI